MSTIKQIEQAIPGIAGDSEIRASAEVLDRVHSLAALSGDSGDAIKAVLIETAAAAIAKIRYEISHGEPSRDFLIQLFAIYDANVSLLTDLISAPADAPTYQAALDELIIQKQQQQQE